MSYTNTITQYSTVSQPTMSIGYRHVLVQCLGGNTCRLCIPIIPGVIIIDGF